MTLLSSDLGALLDAAIWAAAAIPGIGGLAIPLATLASLEGSLFGMPSSGAAPAQAAYVEVAAQIKQNYENTAEALTTQQTAIVTDRFKLMALNTLWQGPWQWNLTDAETIATNGQNGNRLYFYKLLLPQVFTIGVYWNSQYDRPTYLSWNEFDPYTAYLNCPAASYLTEPATQGRYNVYLFCSGTKLAQILYARDELMTDLLTTLNIPKADLFTGVNGWALPTFNGASLTSQAL